MVDLADENIQLRKQTAHLEAITNSGSNNNNNNDCGDDDDKDDKDEEVDESWVDISSKDHISFFLFFFILKLKYFYVKFILL